MGRGKYYYGWRRIGEAVEHLFYTGGWAAHLAYWMRLQGALHEDRHDFQLPGQGVLPPLKLAFASDLHAGPLTSPRLFDSLIASIESFSPDLLLLGGDYVSLHHKYVDVFAERLKTLRIPLGIFGVFGNHDLWADDIHIQQAMEAAGVRFLTNESQTLPAPYHNISVCGLDEPGTGAPDAEKMFDGAASTRLVIMHSPLGLKHLAGHAFNIAFCGHTHGGQIAFPSGRPIILPDGAGDPRYANGHFVLPSGGELLTSRGVGMSNLPIRMFAPSEVHLCCLNFGE